MVHFHTGYGIFHCDSMKYDLMFHSITMKYAVSSMKVPQVQESATSLIWDRIIHLRMIYATDFDTHARQTHHAHSALGVLALNAHFRIL